MRALVIALLLAGTAGCSGTKQATPPPAAEDKPVAKVASEPRGAPLDFILDPLERDFDARPESEVLRGKRAIVLVLTTYDAGSLLALRELAPLLNDLPKDAQCLQVALQPIGDRGIVGPYMDAEKTPCRRAIGDPKRGRLGDLAKIKIVPTVLVLRPDGTLAGGISGTITEKAVRELLEQAKS
ncbi:MAG: hypothetical protein ACXVEE_13175 [Polyangiales bacterium]